jgi:ABC-type uncharacterized transport system permease subunit
MSYILVHALSLVLYMVSAVLYGVGLTLKTPTRYKQARLLFLLAIALHTVAIGTFCVQTRQTPFASAFGTLSIAAWAVALIYVPVEFLGRLPALGVIAAPICTLLLFAAVLRSSIVTPESGDVRSFVINLHVLLVIVSFALFALAACCAILYVWQYSALKHPDRRALFRRLPPLETVDSLAYHLVAFALPLLTLGIILGIARLVGSGGPSRWLTDPHTISSFLAWLVYGGYLGARLLAGWRGTRLNYLLIAGLLLTLAVFFIPSTTHRFA